MKKNDIQADAAFLEAVDAPLLDLHKTSILKLEIDELIHECRLNFNDVPWGKSAKDYIALLSNIISKIPKSVISKDGCPFPLKSDKVNSVEFPLGLTMVPTSSYGINCLTTKSGNANVLPTLECAIVVPNSYWNAKDFLNHRYMDKRNLILWSIAQVISGKKVKKHVGRVQWRYYNGNRNIPTLLITPPTTRRNDGNKRSKQQNSSTQTAKFTVQIVMAMESLNWTPVARLFPNRSNVKGGSATPFYNSLLARDAFWSDFHLMMAEDIAEISSFHDTFILIKVWCLQRGFLRGHDTFDEMHIAFVLLYLFRTRRAASRMAPLQVFTIFVKFLAEEWMTKPMTMPMRGKSEAQTIALCENAKAYETQAKLSPIDPNGDPITLTSCHQQFSSCPAILLNSTMLGNYLGALSPAFCNSVSLQAQRSVACLSSSRSFADLFMTTDRFWTCLDSYFHVPINKISWNRSNLRGSQLQDYGEVECLSRDLVNVLRRALGDRVTNVVVLTTGNGPDVQNGDSDQIPTHDVADSTPTAPFTNALEMEQLVVGLKINADTCHRPVDRGPPADDVVAVREFLELWGDAAELRRFKDGAIVHAVVWNGAKSEYEQRYAVFDGDEKTQGGIVERIVRHVLRVHFLEKGSSSPSFLLREMLGMVEGVYTPDADNYSKLSTSTSAAHRRIMTSFDSLATFLRKGSEQSNLGSGSSELGLPLQIDAVEPLSPSLRYSSTFPALPHAALGGNEMHTGKVAGVISYSPIQIQIRFGRSSKWPTDLKAIGAAKIAMLAQLADGIESLKKRGRCAGFEGPIVLTPQHLTIGYQGYSWRILVRADPELHLLRGLVKPSDDARLILQTLTKEHVLAASHHATVHAIHTLHPSSAHVVRLVNLWLASHLLSGLIPVEAIELLVAKVYSDNDGLSCAPATVVSGFLRVLRLVATHDWVRHPLIVDPQGFLSDIDRATIRSHFDEDRGPDASKGPIMYIIAPYDCKDSVLNEDLSNNPQDDQTTQNVPKVASWRPTYTEVIPERVTLFRLVALAKRTYSFLIDCLVGKTSCDWTAAFKESQTSLKSFSVLLRVDNDFIVDSGFSSMKESMIVSKEKGGSLESLFTRSTRGRFGGPKALRRKVYRNLVDPQKHSVLHDWKPVDETVEILREKLHRYALLFYNEFTPEVLAVLWRPSAFEPKPFTAVDSEYVRPVEDSSWKSDSLIVENMNDFLREIREATRDIVVDVKLFNDPSKRYQREVQLNKRKRVLAQTDTDSESVNSESDSDT